MLFAINKNNNKIFADDAEKNSEYFCPICKQKVIFKNGTLKINHFAHYSLNNCIMNNVEMSEWHFQWQKYFGLENAETHIQIGKYQNIADIKIGDTIIEFQHSKIPYKEIKKRSVFYTCDNKKLFWIFDCQEEYNNQKIQYWKEGLYNNAIYKWGYASSSILAAIKSENTEVFLQLEDDLLIKVTWSPYNEKKDTETLKFFGGIEMTKKECKDYISSKINFNYIPNPNFENTNDYWYLEKQYELIENGLI